MINRPPDDDEAAERHRLIATYESTRNVAYLRAAACFKRRGNTVDRADLQRVFDEGERRMKGRPVVDDFDRLVEMAELIDEDGLSQWAAAKKVATQNRGHSHEATTRRLDRKFREDPHQYLTVARLLRNIEDHWKAIEAAGENARRRWEAIEAAGEGAELPQAILTAARKHRRNS